MPFTEEDWEITEWAIGQINAGKWGHPWVASIECGGVEGMFHAVTFPDALEKDTRRLWALAHAPQPITMSS